MKNYLPLFIFLVIIHVLIQSAAASVIEGNVYDFSLQKIKSAQVTINSQPKQQFIATNGSYIFNVPKGTYLINAALLNKGKPIATVQENITVPEQGTFHLDLILFPNLEQEQELLDTNIQIEEIILTETSKYAAAAAFIAAVAIITIMFIRARKIHKRLTTPTQVMSKHPTEQKQPIGSRHPTEPEHPTEQKQPTEPEKALRTTELPADLAEIINFIETNDARTTQKEIRKQFPQSEAKISLMIADLEQRGLIQKIKKGRGNILILR